MLSGLYARLAGVLLVLALIAGAVFYVHTLRSKIENLEHEKSLVVSENSVLTGKLQLQNAAIEQLQKDAAARIASAKADLDKAKQLAAQYKQNADSIYKAQPSTPNDPCKSALDLMNGAAQ